MAQAETVTITVTNHIFSDESGADVWASMEKYADIVEEQVEQYLGGRILNLEIRTQLGDVLHSIDIVAGDDMTSEDERDLRDELDQVCRKALEGDYGDWVVEAANA